ncbi:MAG: hypothetical protein IPL23_30410 [Saprospiraceae bacterium]|nr:hypothetical protein [Saprospiraceae bacterium]
MEKIVKSLIFFATLVCTQVLAQPTSGFQEKLEEEMKTLALIQIPELKTDSSFQAKGNLKRSYIFAETGQKMPYRLYVPSAYKPGKTPLVIVLHGGGGSENSLVENNNKISLLLAEKYGFIVLSPLGFSPLGAYGTPLRLPAVYGKPDEQAKQKTAFATDTTRQKLLALSEKEVLTALEIVMQEYQPDPKNIFLAGHSMGSGGTWYLGAKYADKWKAIAPMSGPFIDESTYPWSNLKTTPIFMSEGTGATPSLESSRLLYNYLKKEHFNIQYKEVEANHGEMTSLIFPSVFDFFNKQLHNR